MRISDWSSDVCSSDLDDKESILDNEVKWDRESFDLVFWGGFLNKPNIIGKSSLDLYFLALDEDDSDTRLTRNRHIFTPGFRVFSDPEPGHADYELEAAYQFGDIRASSTADAAKLDVSAYFVHAEVGYQFKAPWRDRQGKECVSKGRSRLSTDHEKKKETELK